MARRVITNFRAQDFRQDASPTPRAKNEPDSEKDRREYESAPVPEGTTAEIMEWVGDDADRARRALDAENANEKPRKTLVSQLEGMVTEEGDEE